MTITLSEDAYRALTNLAQDEQTPVESVLEKAIEQYRRATFFARVNAEFAALRADPVAWAEELEERRLSEATLADGLKDDE